MDWSTVLSIGAIILFVILMMRGCGGMMGGGCGTGGCGMGRPRRSSEQDETKDSDGSIVQKTSRPG